MNRHRHSLLPLNQSALTFTCELPGGLRDELREVKADVFEVILPHILGGTTFTCESLHG